MKRKKRKNGIFTILAFVIIVCLLALCIYGGLAALGITGSDDTTPSATGEDNVITFDDLQ